MTTNKNQNTNSGISTLLILLLAVSCGVIVANLYYAQPLIELISSDIGLPSSTAGLVVTLTQMGYCIGLLFIVPLGDILENRKLVVSSLLLTVFALIIGASSNVATLFLIATFFIGLGSVAAQILVPYAAHVSPEASRGRIVGNVMSGLLLGIMLARPVASLVAGFFGWRLMFFLSAGFVLILILILYKLLPYRKPSINTQYPLLLASMWKLVKTVPILRRRAIYHVCVFGAYSLFWTTVPMLLRSPAFHLSQTGIALFALVGVSGAAASPVAGWLADKGLVKISTAIALIIVIISLLLCLLAQTGYSLALLILVIASILLDMGVSANLVLGQRVIFSLGAEYRSRLNGLYMAFFFVGGAIGSAVGGWAYAVGGWNTALYIGIAFQIIALIYFATEK